jgi:hypothetical protein
MILLIKGRALVLNGLIHIYVYTICSIDLVEQATSNLMRVGPETNLWRSNHTTQSWFQSDDFQELQTL